VEDALEIARSVVLNGSFEARHATCSWQALDLRATKLSRWQSRPLEPMCPAVCFDALRVKIRDDAVVRNKGGLSRAKARCPMAPREVLGIWIEQTEGAKFWLNVFNELRSRGINDILIAVVDGLKGLVEAIEWISRRPRPSSPRRYVRRHTMQSGSLSDSLPAPGARRTASSGKGSYTVADQATQAACGKVQERELPKSLADNGMAEQENNNCSVPAEVQQIIQKLDPLTEGLPEEQQQQVRQTE
jgi:hypothetical protein